MGKINLNMEEEEYKEFIEFQKWKKMNLSPKSSNNFADTESIQSEMTYPQQKNLNQNSQSTKLPSNESKSAQGLQQQKLNNKIDSSQNFSQGDPKFKKTNSAAHNN
jgi:hypothetical protein